ncbi:sensor histidine kinase [Desulfovermiculus halophilus]|jgi:two-component system nitrogen regulation sensor histidine kinase NtrY|uniref:sensor histidine kinase n=1 Tax=Desulfovermiculus halophilus TaxID=339722 RepID=UPI00068430CD|nr:ATP-binding protein [Desulfovermiculus halophilus]
MNTEFITAHASRDAKRRRRRELLLALGAFGLIILFSWIELHFFGVNSYLFLIVFNLNLILLLLILFLVLRNMVKLFLERRRKAPGALLRTKLVIVFILLSLIPTVLMFLVSVKFVQTSVDYWFRSQVDRSLQQAVEAGKNFYDQVQKRLQVRGEFIVEHIREQEFLWGGPGMDDYLEQKAAEYGLNLIGVVAPNLQEQNWHAQDPWPEKWPQVQEEIGWDKLRRKPEVWSTLLTAEDQDLVLTVIPVDEGTTGFLVLGAGVGKGVVDKLDQVVEGIEEYKKLEVLKGPLKIAFYLLLGVMALLILFGAIWFGFRLAKEISAPIQALSEGTQRIAHGDLSVRLEDQSTDELGQLVQSFNVMAEDLERSQERLNQANQDLGTQNIELEQRRRYMEVVLNTITSGVISLDPEGRVTTVNQAALTILDMEQDQLLGRFPMQMIAERHQELLAEAMDQVARTPSSTWQRQLDIQLGKSERKLLVNAVGLRPSQGEDMGTVLVFEDITELDKMQRMAAWREVARRIAHEIKNPLTPIKLSAQRLERKYASIAPDESFEECTRLIVRQVEHLQQMVKEFSAFAKLPDVQPERDDLQALLTEVVSLFQNSHSFIHWSLNVQSDLVFRFDRSAMKQVMINLLTNGAEALKDCPDPRVEVSAGMDTQQRWVRLEIRDNGPGIDDQELNRLFEPYFSRKKGNTGLGLTIVKSIVNDHHGYIRVAPNSPQGTVFIIELPAA